MSEPLLTIKTSIPRIRGNLVARQRLIEKIDLGIAGRLIIISAPAGFGKTTLATSWIASTDRHVAWLSLDEHENDIHNFLKYVLAAFQTINKNVGRELQSLLESQSRFQSEALLSKLIAEIDELKFPVSLLLDDYHLVENEQVHKTLEFLIHHLPPQANVIVIGRIDPPIPLARLRAGGALTEIRSDDLRFTTEEVDTFLNEVMHLDLSSDDTAALQTRTEGWIAGLQLAALSLRDREDKHAFIERFSGSHQYIIDYLLEEVIDRLPVANRDFLYRISILDRFCASLCDAVLDVRNSDQFIAQLEESNLFLVSLDDDHHWFRFHHLFADFLRHASTVDSEERYRIYQRASTWFKDQGQYVLAIEHSAQASDFLEAARIIAQIGMKLLEDSELARLIRLVNKIPSDQACAYPWVCVYHAWALRLTGGGYEEVEHLLNCAEDSARLSSGFDPEQTREGEITSSGDANRMKSHLAAIRAYQALYREDIPSVIRLAKAAVGFRPEGNFIRSSIALAQGWAYRFSGDLDAAVDAFEKAREVGIASKNWYLAITSTCRLAYTYMLKGKLTKAESLCREALQLARPKGGRQLQIAGYVQIYLGYIQYARNQLDESLHNLIEGIELCGQVGYVVDQIVGSTLLARVYRARGDDAAAQEALDQAEQLCGMMKGYMYAQRWMEDGKVRIWGAMGRWQELKTWVTQSELGINDPPTFLREVEQLILARALVSLLINDTISFRQEELFSFMDGIRQAVHDAGWASKEIEILILQSIARQHVGEHNQALQLMDHALHLAAPESHLSPFLEEGEPVRKLLGKLSADRQTKDIHSLLMDTFKHAAQTVNDRARPDTKKRRLIEPLSKRELEVLQLLAGELSGPEIAAQLFIAVSTLRYHTNQIYTKLAVHSRREAVARARELGLI